jgi:hypothetical protein
MSGNIAHTKIENDNTKNRHVRETTQEMFIIINRITCYVKFENYPEVVHPRLANLTTKFKGYKK